MSKKSQRENRGLPPAYLKDYKTEFESDSSDSSNELDTTIVAEMADDSVKALLEKLTLEFMTMKAELTAKSDNLQRKLEEKDKALHAKLESTNQQLAEVQASMRDPSKLQTAAPETFASSPAASNSASTSFATITSYTNATGLTSSQPSCTFSGNLSNQTSDNNTTSPEMHVPVMAYNSPFPMRKHLIALPKFDGDPKDWLVFSADYKRTTVEFKYSSSENTTRLNDSLKGKARDLVHWLLVHDDMADKIMERLQSRFGRPEMLVDAQIKMLKDIPNISEANIEQVVPFADAVLNFSHFMLSSSSQHQLMNPTLLNELISKLPMSMKINWGSHSNSINTFPTILDFSNCIEVQADNIARVVGCGSMMAQKEKKTISKKGQIYHASSSTSGKRNSCAMCNKDHLLTNCSDFTKKNINDRWSFVRDKRLCFTCLKDGHNTKTCRNRKSCGKDGCNRVHNPMLHADSNNFESHERTSEPPSNTVVNYHAVSKENTPRVLFKIVPVKLYNGDQTVSTFAMIDEGSSVSLMNYNLAQRIGLSGPKRKLNLQWFGDHSSSEESDVVKFQISGVHSTAELFEMSNVCTVSDLRLPVQTLEVQQLQSKYSYLRNLPIASYDARPELLIGLDYCYLGVSKRKLRHATNGPIVAESPLGWIVYGRSSDQQTDSNPVRMFLANENLDELNSLVKDYFTTENFGVKEPEKITYSNEDSRAMNLLQCTTKKVNGRYESGLLWRSDIISLPNSEHMALSRLQCVENKMAKDPTYATKYKQTIASYIEKGYARKLSKSEAENTTSRTWYLPHFGVMNPNKPDKFRLVFDAAATVNGTSLNTSLLTGPNLNQPLLTVLSKFREGEVAVCADIKEMFHQVVISQEDQDSQRFLWRHEQTGNVESYKMLVMTFGSTSSPTTAQFVKNFHAQQYLDTHPDAAEAIIYKHYVDDYVCSFKNKEDAIRVSKDVKEILLAGGFDLRGFISNSWTVASALNPQNKDQLVHIDMDLEKSSSCDKILGMVWDTSTDEFRFQVKFHRIDKAILSGNRVPTKREFLAIVMSVYDPFGFIADFLIFMKVLLQSVWRAGIEWDQPLPTHHHERWCSWNEELKKVSNFRIPRCLDNELWTSKSIELHIFVDSSEVAFSAVCYIRIILQDDIRVAFIMGKTKCAPLKFLSIPRLELQAALLGVRMFKTVITSQSLKVTKSIFWSDSKTVLHWIRDDRRRYKTFVANRVSEILDSTNPGQWKWVPTRHNPADDATRDKYPPLFNRDRRWITGPEWLQEDEENWPQQPEFQVDENDLELHTIKHLMLFINEEGLQLDFSKYSSYFKILRAIGWIIRYCSNLKAKSIGAELKSGELRVYEIEKAENIIFRTVQMDVYHQEYNSLSQKKTITKDSKLHNLTPALDEHGVIRLNGRIDNAPTLPMMTKRPIILPKHHPLTTLIVKHYHDACRHQNEEVTICEIRRKFWVNDLRVLVRAAKRNCQHCKIGGVQPQTPLMGQLPPDRLTPYIQPFTFCGLDYFGPVYVTIGRRREKRWVALFTCLTVRAVHLELAQDLSTDACIMCLRNFVNLRGIPKRIRSDNGSNFIGVKGELLTIEDVYDKNSIIAESTMKGIEWRFNCPSNPSAGGCWERLVRSIKSVLKQTLKEVAPRVETLRSYLIEAANIVNSRPLTHVPVTSTDEEPLTPNSFLLGISNCIQSNGIEDDKLWTYRKQWRIANALKNHFWRRWVKEYLPTLTRRTKWFNMKEPIKIGDLVIVCDEDVPRRQWVRGIVQKVFPGQDGQVRRAEIRTSGRVLQRPASKLAVLDVDSKSAQDQEMIYGAQDVDHSNNNVITTGQILN